MSFEIIGDTTDIETIAVGSGIRGQTPSETVWQVAVTEAEGIARIRLASGRLRLAELHWYEAHSIGKKEIKRKRYLD